MYVQNLRVSAKNLTLLFLMLKNSFLYQKCLVLKLKSQYIIEELVLKLKTRYIRGLSTKIENSIHYRAFITKILNYFCSKFKSHNMPEFIMISKARIYYWYRIEFRNVYFSTQSTIFFRD